MPCAAAIAAVHRELGGRWALFAAAWTTGLAYGAAVAAYQIGTFSRDPASATAWLAVVAVGFGLAVAAMRVVGRSRRPVPQIAE